MVIKVKQSPKWLGQVANLATAVLALVGVAMMQVGGNLGGLSGELGLSAVSIKQAQAQEVLNLQLMKVAPTFGFDNLVADWIFLKYIQYFGDVEVRSQTGYSLNELYFEIIINRDPRWVDIYPFLSTGVSYYLGKPEIGVAMMDRGVIALSPEIDPQAWRVWRFKGLDEFLLLGDIRGAIHSHDMAADWVLGTPDKRFAPLFRETAKFLREDPDDTLVRFLAWSSVYDETKDKLVRERAKQALLGLGAKIRKDKAGNERFFLPNDQAN
jgi:hypothetical protein